MPFSVVMKFPASHSLKRHFMVNSELFAVTSPPTTELSRAAVAVVPTRAAAFPLVTEAAPPWDQACLVQTLRNMYYYLMLDLGPVLFFLAFEILKFFFRKSN